MCSHYNYCGNPTYCKDGEDGTLNYLRATGPDDVLHYAWSTVGYPTIFISRSPYSNNSNDVNNCLSHFHVHNYTEFRDNQEPGSVSINGTSTNFSFALIFKSLVEFKVSTRKLQGARAFNPNLAHNCSENPGLDGCYYVYQLHSSNLDWSSYDPSVGLSATNDTLLLHLKVSI